MNALNKKTLFTYFKEGGIYVVLLVLLAIIIIQDPTFLSLMNLSNILTQSSVRIIIALGVAGLIVTQGTDLSAGRQVGLAAVVAATQAVVAAVTPSKQYFKRTRTSDNSEVLTFYHLIIQGNSSLGLRFSPGHRFLLYDL